MLQSMAALFVHGKDMIVFVQDARLEVPILLWCQLSVNHDAKRNRLFVFWSTIYNFVNKEDFTLLCTTSLTK